MEQPKFEISLSQEYEQKILGRLTDLIDVAIDNALNKNKLQRRLVTQTELRNLFSIGQQVIDEFEINGLNRYKVGNKVMYDIDEVERIIKQK